MRVADEAEEMRHDHRGNQAAAHLGITELGVRRGGGEIAHGRKPGAARHGRAIDRRDGRRREVVD